nr:9586_t:CDS:2 [Entrophospora candida]
MRRSRRNLLTEIEASNQNPIIEAFLRHEIVSYDRKKQRPLENRAQNCREIATCFM